MARIYGKVETPEDISRINCIIRDEMLKVQDEAHLSELKKRSDYLCTLSYSPFWQKKFANELEELREIAIQENRATVKTANIVAKYKGFNKEYNPWKKELEISLDDIPQSVLDEIKNTIFTLKLDLDILEDLRKQFCDIRKAMVLCEDLECLDKLKRAVDILSLLPYAESFAKHFDNEEIKKIDELINLEKERSVNLANIISEVNSWDRMYQSINEEDSSQELLEELLKEEQKAESYIPTEAKYKGNAKVLWLVYYLPRRKRDYAKRIYFPADAFDIKLEGPAIYKNRFGNEVYGLKIEYKMTIKPTTIHLRGKEIHLPQRVVTKTKIVTVPKDANNIRILEEKPKSAMDIA